MSYEEKILELAESCSTSSVFVQKIECEPVARSDMGSFCMAVGGLLYNTGKIDFAIAIWNHALNYLADERTKNQKAQCYLNLGSCYLNLGKIDLAIQHYENSLGILKETNDYQTLELCYQNLGIAHENKCDFDSAIKYFEKAFDTAQFISDKRDVTYSRYIASAYSSKGDFKNALIYFNQTLSLARKYYDKFEESAALKEMGAIHFYRGNFTKAEECFSKSLKLDSDSDYKSGIAKSLTNLGNVKCSLGDTKSAVELHTQALTIAGSIGDIVCMSICYTNLGIAYEILCDFHKAMDYYNQSTQLIVNSAERGNIASQIISSANNNLGNVYHKWGKYVEATKCYEAALELAKHLKNAALIAKCLINLGLVYTSRGRLQVAISFLENARQISQSQRMSAEEAMCYRALGVCYLYLGQTKEAIDFQNTALAIAKNIQYLSEESAAYMNFGSAYVVLAQYSKALVYYNKALEIDEKIGSQSEQCKSYTNIGNVYCELGDYEEAKTYHEKALTIANQIGSLDLLSSIYSNLGLTYERDEDTENRRDNIKHAITLYDLSRQLSEKMGSERIEAAANKNLGSAHAALGEFTNSLVYYDKALGIDKIIGDRFGEAQCYTDMGTVYYGLKDTKSAEVCFNQASNIAKEMGYADLERIINLNLGLLYQKGEPNKAYASLKRSIELSEIVSKNIIAEEDKKAFYSHASAAYQAMVPLCLKMGMKDEEAFENAEASKSRAFLEVISNTQLNPTVELTDDLRRLLTKEQRQLIRLRELQNIRSIEQGAPSNIGESDALFGELDCIYQDIDQIDPEYVLSRRAKPITLKQIQNILASFSKETGLVEYFVTEQETYIFVVSKNGLYVKHVPVTAEKIRQQVIEYYMQLDHYDLKKGPEGAWLELSKNLLIDYFNKFELIYFVPYGIIHYIPLQSLILNGEPLIKNHAIAYLPNASLLRTCLNRGSGQLKTCASFGVDFEDEAKEVAELFGTPVYLGPDANRAKIREQCHKDILHFSCHGQFDPKEPLSSMILLGDGELSAREIFSLKFYSELITLSACETGINQRSRGDELVGLTRAFLYAGAPSLLVSLWRVSGQSTKELMVDFYRQLQHHDKATALRIAQNNLMQKYPEPYNWAPFILIGKT